MNKLALVALGAMVGAAHVHATPVTAAGKEWRQLTETTNFSPNEVATVCDKTTGACAGSLGSVSFDGWTWASNTDVQQLFNALIPLDPPAFPTNTSDFEALDSAAIAAALTAPFFAPTATFTSGAYASRRLDGFTRTSPDWDLTDPPMYVFAPGIRDDEWTAPITDNAWLGNGFFMTDQRWTGTGVWLFKTPTTPMPEPTTLPLALAGVVAGWAVRRRYNARAGSR